AAAAQLGARRQGVMPVRLLKLAINPRLVFRGADKIRERYIENWYHPTGTLHFTVEKRQHANMAA
ncbi:hypothetical protein JR315_13020, partial [Pseudomonas aeruginosa]|nr:hypothetical protein [Pseudomonas aeruginosa]